MKKIRIVIMITILIIAIGLLVWNATNSQFSLTSAIGQIYDLDILKPRNENTLVISASITNGEESSNTPYLISDQVVSQISELEGVDAVYPISLIYNSVMFEGINAQYNYLNQNYKLTGEVGPDVHYDTEIDLTVLDPKPFLTEDEYKLAESKNMTWEVYENSYGSLVTPRYPFEVLNNTTLSDTYTLDLLVGDYPQDDSNQLLISDKLAYTICDGLDGCDKIDSLVGTEYDVNLTGWFKAATIPDVTMTGTVSGIYFGNRSGNDVITSYQSSLSRSDALTEMINHHLDLMSGFSDTSIGVGYQQISADLTNKEQEQLDDALSQAVVDPNFGNYPQLVVTVTDKQAAINEINDLGLDLIVTEYEETT